MVSRIKFLKSRMLYVSPCKIVSLCEMKISPQRLHFILIDTKEILEKVYSGGGLEDVKVEKNTETFKSIVRSAFATWLDNDTAIPAEIGNMKSSDFLEGSLLFLPDCDDHYSLSYFICFVLKKRPKNPEALKAVFQACLNGFVEQGVEKDSPHIYEHISILLCQMIINNVITVEEVLKARAFSVEVGVKWRCVVYLL